MTNVWKYRGGKEGQYEELALSNGTTGGGWVGMGDLTEADFETMKHMLAADNPEESERTIRNWAGQLRTLGRE